MSRSHPQHRRFSVTTALTVGVALVVTIAGRAQGCEAKDIEKWIAGLKGKESWVRDAAKTQLNDCGAAAIAPLRQTLAENENWQNDASAWAFQQAVLETLTASAENLRTGSLKKDEIATVRQDLARAVALVKQLGASLAEVKDPKILGPTLDTPAEQEQYIAAAIASLESPLGALRFWFWVRRLGGWTPLVAIFGAAGLELRNLVSKDATTLTQKGYKRLTKFATDWALLSQFERRYYRSLKDLFGELSVEGYRIGLPVLDLKDIFVALRVVPDATDRIPGALVTNGDRLGGDQIWKFLAQSTKIPAYRRLAVIAPPGAGKTTLLQHLTLAYALREHHRHDAPDFIPVLLYLRNFRERIVKENATLTLPQLICDRIQQIPTVKKLKPEPDWLEKQLIAGNVLVMLDGLDEVADATERATVSAWVNRAMTDYGQSAFILTSRPDGYKSAPVERVGTVLAVLPFNADEIRQFVTNWYLQTEIRSRAGRDTPAVRAKARENAKELIEKILEKRAIAEMACNPLLVTMIATVHYCGSALPGRRVELYQRICDLLLGPRQEAKKIKTQLTAEQNKTVLQVLALGLMERNTREFDLGLGAELIAEELRSVAGEKLTPRKFLKQIKEVNGLLVERETDVYEFAHLSFQEYLAAAQLRELQQDRILRKNFTQTWWEETIRLYAAQGDATSLVHAALENPTVASLSLALDCVQEKLKIDPAVEAELNEKLEAGLESEDPQVARLAAQVKLKRRLDNLVPLDEARAIATSYITKAEYRLSLERAGDKSVPTLPFIPNRQISGFQNKPVGSVTLAEAWGFCTWLTEREHGVITADSTEVRAAVQLSLNFQGKVVYYRLPTRTEIDQRPVVPAERHLKCQRLGEPELQQVGLRVVRAECPPLYSKLISLLHRQEWESADEETLAILLQQSGRRSPHDKLSPDAIAQLPGSCLETLAHLWQTFAGFEGLGFGPQVSLALSAGGKPLPYRPSLWWQQATEPMKTHAALVERFISLGIERSLPEYSFSVVTVDAQGQEIRRDRGRANFFREDLGNSTGLDMIAIPGGSFLMGSPETGRDRSSWEGPQHEETVQEFFIGRYPVTQAQWQVVAALSKVKRELKPDPSQFKGRDRPVEMISWDEAMEFCDRLTQHTGRKYRLPSEAEWEYACRADTTTPFHFGETITAELANYGQQEKGTTPVGSYEVANAFGSYDMHGNVWEWCADRWRDNYRGIPTNIRAFFERDKVTTYVVRGGSWSLDPRYCRSAYRSYFTRVNRFDIIGFRVCCDSPRTLGP